jgi:hypothetical protein
MFGQKAKNNLIAVAADDWFLSASFATLAVN